MRMRLRRNLPNSTRSACAISQASASVGVAASSLSARFLLLPPSKARGSRGTRGQAGEAMLAWKEKVADRLARLLADSPPAPAAPVEAPPAIPFPAEHFVSTNKGSLSSYMLSFVRTSNSGLESNSASSETLRPLPPESLPKRWRGNDFTLKDPPLELSEESGSESERDERNGYSSNNHVPQSLRSIDNSNGSEETSTSDSAGSPRYLTEKSMFISPKLFAFFQSSLPGTLKGCHWILLYSAVPGSMGYL